ncbi:hypothetical protein GTY65_11655 [Streptomyces sp. SID8379]|uniref:hypothetical protein n=1 Tax=unclassified Streptomyces TaxID=2593676 RepID=UPI00035C3C2B|nr:MULTISPECIES: hypothetical protein [unclassified Streptomyces]MYW64718.1 hypothetical protein [Streptomyces sp. SID8379]
MPRTTIHRAAAALRDAHRRGGLWPWWLAVIAAVCGCAAATVFHPGYFSADSAFQLRQAVGEVPVSDWHPPVLALLWRGLLSTTGSLSTMVDLQAALLWGSLWMLARLVWRGTGSRCLSLAMLSVGLAPHIMNFTGVVWKDVHLAYALLAVCALALTARGLPAGRTRTRWVLLVLGVLLIVYAGLVRKNGFPAVLPVFALLVLALWPAPGRRRWLAATGVLAAVTAVGSVGVTALAHPLPTRVYAVIPVDDLVHVLTPAQVRAAAEEAGGSRDFTDRMVTATTDCRRRGLTSNAYLECYPRKGGTFDLMELSRNADVLTRMWTRQMPRHWQDYAAYRGRVFTKLLFRSNQPFLNGTRLPGSTLPEIARHEQPNDTLRAALRDYVTGCVRNLPMLFQGWFWLAVSLVLVLRRRWPGPYSRELRLIGASSLVYILAYLPTAPESNFRYVYWPALAGTVACVFVVSAYVVRWRAGAPVAEPRTEPVPRQASPVG